jgi:uncharacterized protein YjeT (DUF2065 family)
LDRKTVEVPILSTLAVPILPPVVASAAPSRPAAPPEPLAETQTFTPERLRWLGIGSVALGVVAWAAGGYALATALDENDAAAAHCWVDGCDDVGLHKRSDAVSHGNWATALGITGAVLVGTGVTLVYFGQRSSSPPGAARSPTRLVVSATPGTVMTAIAGEL